MNYESDREIRREALDEDESAAIREGESHATTGGAAAAGAVTGGVIGLTGGPVGAAIGAVGGAIVGAAAERMMHGTDDDRPETDEPAPETAAAEVDDQPRSAAPVAEPLADIPATDRKPPEERPLI